MGTMTSVAFSFSVAGIVIPATTASISALCSILIMITIFRSKMNRTSAYHCILFFMSFGDAIASIAMALTTIPMPSDVGEVYAFAGNSYGNKTTCEAQGFCYLVGTSVSLYSAMILNLYYVCTIRFGMAEEKIKKILAIAILLSTVFSVGIPAITVLPLGLLNPAPFEPYCLGAPFPYDCERDEAGDVYACDRKSSPNKGNFPTLVTIGNAILLVTFFCVMCSMLLVFEAVFKIEAMTYKRRSRATMGIARDPNEEGGGDRRDVAGESEESNFQQTKMVLRTAVMYIGAFLVTWLWTLMLQFARGRGSENFYWVVDIFKVIFQPLQGFFNACIFFSHKAYSLRKADRQLTFLQALKKAIVLPQEVPGILISSVSMLDHDKLEGHEDIEELEDERLSFQLESNKTPSEHMSNALSENTKILKRGAKEDYSYQHYHYHPASLQDGKLNETPSAQSQNALSDNTKSKESGIEQNQSYKKKYHYPVSVQSSLNLEDWESNETPSAQSQNALSDNTKSKESGIEENQCYKKAYHFPVSLRSSLNLEDWESNETPSEQLSENTNSKEASVEENQCYKKAYHFPVSLQSSLEDGDDSSPKEFDSKNATE